MFITSIARPLVTHSAHHARQFATKVPALKNPLASSVEATIEGLKTNVRAFSPKVQDCMTDWRGRSVMWHGYTGISRKENESIVLMGYFLRTQGWPIHIAHLATTARGSDAPEVMRHLENVCLVCETTAKPSENVVVDFRLPHFNQRNPRSPEAVFQRPFISTFESVPDRALPQPIFIGKQTALFEYICDVYATPPEASENRRYDDLEIKEGYHWLAANTGPIFCETSPLLGNIFGFLLHRAGALPADTLIDKYHQNIQEEPLLHFNTAFNRFRHSVKEVVSEIEKKQKITPITPK